MMHVGWITDSQDAADFYNAVSGDTRHVQFTDNQSGIPTNNGGTVEYDTLSFFVPNPALQLPILDFFDNALTKTRTKVVLVDRKNLHVIGSGRQSVSP